MSTSFEGDLIRPLGLVTLYFAYAEYELDLLLEDLSELGRFGDPERQWQVGRKLSQAETSLSSLQSPSLKEFRGQLAAGRSLFERRNTLVHSCIFAGGRVVSGRPGTSEWRTSPDELIALANQIFDWKERISAYRFRTLRPLLAALGKHQHSKIRS